MVLEASALLFTVFLVVCSWWPKRWEALKTGAFIGCWLLQIPMCYMDVGSYSESVVSGLNPGFSLYLALFWLTPMLAGVHVGSTIHASA
jgi:Mn2+/Fe2+ NRAMP family transporter